MVNHSASNKKIAKNTAFLYFRMLFLTAISLYTVRVTLHALGDVDYGIYNVVASVVASLSFLNGTLTSATQRFFSFHLGKNDYDAYSRTYSMMLVGFIVISIVLIIIGEFIGIFFVDDWLVIPTDRLMAAKWVYQTAIFTFIFHFLSVPFTSSIVANERMDAFAYISIIDGVLKLLLVYMLSVSPIDRLIYYGMLTLAESIIILSLYILYCKLAITYCKFRFSYDRGLLRELTSYTGWNMFGSVAGVLITQGQNIILNIFFGPLVNTAKAIADKVNAAVISFSINFSMAVGPQIIKSYAEGNVDRAMSLAVKSSRFSFFLILILSFPLMAVMRSILDFWLGNESVNTTMVQFANLSLVYCMITSLEIPLTQIIRATGNVRAYQFKVGIFTLMYIPIAALILYLGGNPTSTMVVLVVLYALVHGLRLKIVHDEVGLGIKSYILQVVTPILYVSAIVAILYILLDKYLFCHLYFMLNGLISIVVASLSVWCFGLTSGDRNYIKSIALSKLNKSI